MTVLKHRHHARTCNKFKNTYREIGGVKSQKGLRSFSRISAVRFYK